MPEEVNEIAMAVSEKVHLGEFVVTRRCRSLADRRPRPRRLPFRDSTDISAAIPTSFFQGRNHGD
jgi:hypothetical protein